MKRKINSLYIHIPFCNKICSYCSFFKIYYFEKIAHKYISNLILDIKKVRQNFFKFKTIYIGGGTPSSLSVKELEKLLKNVSLLKRKNSEFSIEINLDSIDEEKLNLFRKYGVNRISIGIESFLKKYLDLMNRSYDFDVSSKIDLVKKYFTNFNLDLIYGLPNETMEELKFDLENIVKFEPKHISIYALEVNPNSKFYLENIKEENEENLRKQYDFIVNFLKAKGYYRYEVSNFARKNYESKHNLNYWHDLEYVALGSSSSGYIDNIRYVNSCSITSYNKGERNKSIEIISKESDKTYYLLTNLRLERGFKLNDYKKRFNEDFYENKKTIIDDFIKHKVLIKTKDRIKIAKDYIYVLDSILVKLI